MVVLPFAGVTWLNLGSAMQRTLQPSRVSLTA